METKTVSLKNGKNLTFYHTTQTVHAVDPFPLTGAIVRSRCTCGLETGQPVHGTPKQHAHRKGATFQAWCPSRAHASA